jgi:UDP-N-acetylmuramyl pentapeptide phosphotransferase/UDP-N-acetylglucosamine-1-phosphate transferase
MVVAADLLTLAAAGLASALLIAAMLASGRTGALDQPNQRSLHTRPVPRSGGLGILLATMIGRVAASAPVWLAGAVVLVASVSWLDDQRHLPILLRFAGHFAAAGIVAWSGGLPAWPLWAMAAALLAMVWLTNLYNFMDGINGLAGGMAVFGFGTLALGAQAAGASDAALLAGCIAAGAVGFLLFNFDPARIFMGDVGSITLGFLAAILGFDGVRRELWPLWFPIMAFSPFIVDASVTLLRRGLRGERVWQAHREHYYQRLVRMGWSHRRTALAEYALMASMAALALLLRAAPTMLQVLGLIAGAAVYLVLAFDVDRRWRQWRDDEAIANR